MKSFYLFFLLLALNYIASAQNHNDEHHHEHEHEHAGFELGVGAGPFYLIAEEEWPPGMHLHAVYNIQRFGIGLGYERVFADIIHNGCGLVLAYRPLEGLELVLSPGVLFENAETGKHLFALHLEAMYSWKLGEIGHVGPVVGYGIAGEDKHLMLGLHFGFDL